MKLCTADESLAELVRAAPTDDACRSVAAGKGYHFTAAEMAQAISAQPAPEAGEVRDDELGAVNGGRGIPQIPAESLGPGRWEV
jgi:predicted ribosomally synthesized peptide with nif11-like leader